MSVAQTQFTVGSSATLSHALAASRPLLSLLQRSEPVLRRICLISAIYMIPLWILARPVLDADLWWHLRTGDWILEHWRVPSTDPFSSFGQGRPWLAYSWLFDVAVSVLYRSAGLTGILLFRFAMVYAMTIAIHVVLERSGMRFDQMILIFIASLLGLLPIDSERPWHFSALFSLITLVATKEMGRDTQRIWWLGLPLLFAIWANLHVQFAFGLGLLGLATLCAAIDQYRSKRRNGWTRPIVLALMTATCFIATGLNPYGFELYRPILEYCNHTFVYEWVDELKAPLFRSLSDWSLVGLAGMGAYVIGRTRPRGLFWCALLAISTYLGLRSARDCWILVVTCVALISDLTEKEQWRESRLRYTPVRVAAIVGLVAAMSVTAVSSHRLTSQGLREAVWKNYPAGAATYLDKNEHGLPIYNHFNWGGYLLWRLPDRKVSMDGRTNLHGDSRIERASRVWSGATEPDADPEFLSAALILAPREAALGRHLRHDPRFELRYEDKLAFIFKRKKQ